MDYFFLFMGMNAQKNPDESLVDPYQYLFLMKEMQVKSEFKIHSSVLFLDKNVDNFMGNKFLLSLGYDQNVDMNTGTVGDTFLVFKIWEFVSLDGKFAIMRHILKILIDLLQTKFLKYCSQLNLTLLFIRLCENLADRRNYLGKGLT